MLYPFKVIAIGLSAGGLTPLKTILQMLPEQLDAAIVIIPHLHPGFKSRLDDILERIVKRPVIRIVPALAMQPAHIYTLPEGQNLSVTDGHFGLQPRQDTEKVNKAIDHFFTSLAKDAGSQAIGIILSGAGFDGIEGARAIEDRKGVVMVQDPLTAEFPMMPEGMIARDHPDYVLTPEEIVHKLIQHCDVQY